MVGLSALALSVALLNPPVADPFDMGEPLPEPDHTAANVLLLTGGLMVVAGVAGLIWSPGCATRDDQRRCTDAQNAHPVYPALVVIGLGATVTGSYWRRQDLR